MSIGLGLCGPDQQLGNASQADQGLLAEYAHTQFTRALATRYTVISWHRGSIQHGVRHFMLSAGVVGYLLACKGRR